MRLIDADNLVPDICDAEIEYGTKPVHFSANAIDLAPTVDAIPVVRCRECKNWKPSGSKAGNSISDMEYIGGCEFTKYCRRESDFCSYGERKEGADNG